MTQEKFIALSKEKVAKLNKGQKKQMEALESRVSVFSRTVIVSASITKRNFTF